MILKNSWNCGWLRISEGTEVGMDMMKVDKRIVDKR